MSDKRPPLQPGDIYPSHILRDEYGLNAENRPVIVVDPSEVPEDLHCLISVVERWAIPCDVTRGDFVDKQEEVEVAKFFSAVAPHVERINDWLDLLPEDVGEWSEAAVHFMYLLKAHTEAYQPSPEEIAEGERRFSKLRTEYAEQEAMEKAVSAFRNKDYRLVVSLLAPYEHMLEGSLESKYRFAIKRASSGG